MPSMLPAALGVSAAGSLGSGLLGANASEQAASDQEAAALQGIQLQRHEFQQTQNNLMPFITTGSKELGALASQGVPQFQSMFGSPQGEMDWLKNTPGYQFTLQQGLQANQNSNAAMGLGKSGAALKGADTFATGLASGTFQNQFQNFLAQQQQGFNQQFNISQLGESAAAGLGSLGQQSATAQNQLLTGGAAAQAAGTVGATNAITGGISGATGGLSQYALLSALSGGKGMFGGQTGSATSSFTGDYNA